MWRACSRRQMDEQGFDGACLYMVIGVMMNRKAVILFVLCMVMVLSGCNSDGNKSDESGDAPVYELESVHQVNGRQGVCTEGDFYWVSGSASLTKYDSDWNVVAENPEPFEGFELEVNHIGDIDVYDNELYVGVEYFMDGEGICCIM